MGCAASSQGKVTSHSTTYPIRAPPTEMRIRNDPRHQHQPYYTSQQQKSLYGEQQQGQNFRQQEPVLQSARQQQKPIANVQPQQQNRRAVEVTAEILKRYVELELEAREWQSKGVGKAMKLKHEQLEDLRKVLEDMELKYETAVRQTEKEKADDEHLRQSDNVREFIEDQATYDELLTKEQEEYLEALNRQELLRKEVEMTKKQCDTLIEEVSNIKEDVDTMNRVYAEQDELLYSIFQGRYGSELENQLELELDGLLDKKDLISMAKTRWHNGLMLLRHAYQQLAFAVNRWKELSFINTTQITIRWQYATETRNNLLAAQKNITSAQRYLNKIQFPYCEPEEIDTLNRAVANIYTDMQSSDRQEHAAKCYSVTYRQCAALIQWFDAVINNIIINDLDVVMREVHDKSQQLRVERLRLFRGMCSDNIGPEVKKMLNEAAMSGASRVEESDDDTLVVIPDTLDLEEEVITEIDKCDQLPGPFGDTNKLARPVTAPTPMAQHELAPLPRSDDIFGNIEEIKKVHDEKMEEFTKAQKLSKARQEQGLQDIKLAARRRWRANVV